jgi:hydrogenase nickel incorporation protein HypA/HybF
MHELGMCEPLVQAVTARADGRRVTGIGVRVGSRHRVDPAAFEMAFTLAAEGTVAEGATMELIDEPAQLRCNQCEAEGEWSVALALCPSCGSADVAISGGDELVLEWITMAPAGER